MHKIVIVTYNETCENTDDTIFSKQLQINTYFCT